MYACMLLSNFNSCITVKNESPDHIVYDKVVQVIHIVNWGRMEKGDMWRRAWGGEQDSDHETPRWMNCYMFVRLQMAEWATTASGGIRNRPWRTLRHSSNASALCIPPKECFIPPLRVNQPIRLFQESFIKEYGCLLPSHLSAIISFPFTVRYTCRTSSVDARRLGPLT